MRTGDRRSRHDGGIVRCRGESRSASTDCQRRIYENAGRGWQLTCRIQLIEFSLPAAAGLAAVWANGVRVGIVGSNSGNAIVNIRAVQKGRPGVLLPRKIHNGYLYDPQVFQRGRGLS